MKPSHRRISSDLVCWHMFQGALGLVTRLATALQPSARAAGDGKSNDGATSEEEEESEAGGNRGMRDAVLAAARHVSGGF